MSLAAAPPSTDVPSSSLRQSSESISSDSHIPTYPTSAEITDLLSTLAPLPPSLLPRLNDAHAHPTDTPSSLHNTDPSLSGRLCAMSTRPNDQDIVRQFALQNKHIVPYFGYHPWFAHLFSMDTGHDKLAHYTQILSPAPSDEFLAGLPVPQPWSQALDYLRASLAQNPRAQVGEIGVDKSFRLPIHSGLAGGERENCAAWRELSGFRTGMEHQRRVFMDQLRVAVEMERGVSVHSVQCHGVVYDCLRQLGEESHCKVSKKEHKRRNARGKKTLDEGSDGVGNAEIEGEKGDNTNNHDADNTAAAATENNNDNPLNPPRICIHSASLSPSTLSQYLSLSLPLHVYFSFSLVINARYGAKLLDLIRAVPDDRILIESDFHSEGEQRRMLLEGIARVVLGVKGWEVEQGVGILERNWERFVYGERAEVGGG